MVVEKIDSLFTSSEIFTAREFKSAMEFKSGKLLTQEQIQSFREQHKDKKIVFTNGCFDIIHVGHVGYLRKAAELGDILIIGLNSDDSVRRLKGASRPINTQVDRAEILSALEFVDYIAIFDEDTPLNLIKLVHPDVLVKGGDYKPEEVVGREEVEKLVLIPVVAGKSTTITLEKLKKAELAEAERAEQTEQTKRKELAEQLEQSGQLERSEQAEKLEQTAHVQDKYSSLIALITQRLKDSIAVKEQLLVDKHTLALVAKLTVKIKERIRAGNKIVLCGNGGSASDALHFAGEIIGRFQRERTAWPAVVLNADVATMTAVANDYGFDEVFARQAEAHVKDNDIFIGISTSGNSENVLKAVGVAKKKGATTAALLGRDGGKIAKEVDYPVIIPCSVTARIQEAHICLIHILCELVETPLALYGSGR